MARPAASSLAPRGVAAATAAAIACAVVGGALATDADAASWHCGDYAAPPLPEPEFRHCDLPHDPEGSGKLVIWLWVPSPPPMLIQNRGGHPAKIQIWSFGILRDQTRVPANGKQRIEGSRPADRFWGAGTTGETTIYTSGLHRPR